MDGFTVMKSIEAAQVGEVFITVTGGFHAIGREHIEAMPSGAILSNSGHFNVEIDIPALEEMAVSHREVRPFVEEYSMKDGRKLYLLGEGRLINLAAAEGHPSAVMDMSFANQALSAEYIVKNQGNLAPGVHGVPTETDREVGRLKLESLGVGIDSLTAEQQNTRKAGKKARSPDPLHSTLPAEAGANDRRTVPMPIQFMTSPKYLLTSESVTEGHPDKLCDQISDAVLDAALRGDPMSRVACETVATKNLVMVTGEITTQSDLNFDDIARGVMLQIGYTDVSYGIDGNSCGVIAHVSQQSPDISSGVSTALEERGSGASDARRATGAGDQGMMVGFACDETDGLMPITVDLSHRLVEQLAAVRKDGLLDYLGPDGKSQVTVEYSNGKPKRVDAVVISSQHQDSDDRESFTKKIRNDVLEHVIRPIVPAELLDDNTRYFVNPSGWFNVGGPRAIPALPAARSWWTPTAASPATAAAPSPARIRRRLTAPVPTPPGTLPRISWPRDWPSASRSSSPTPSALPSPSPYPSRLSTPATSPTTALRLWSASTSTSGPAPLSRI